ncbi:MAG: heavy metal translocating P-type ATPase [Acidobacteria bacterium]|nr:MAG: heavy metal translocating P-type ATPase [Acidobacteriota bacterium]
MVAPRVRPLARAVGRCSHAPRGDRRDRSWVPQGRRSTAGSGFRGQRDRGRWSSPGDWLKRTPNGGELPSGSAAARRCDGAAMADSARRPSTRTPWLRELHALADTQLASQVGTEAADRSLPEPPGGLDDPVRRSPRGGALGELFSGPLRVEALFVAIGLASLLAGLLAELRGAEALSWGLYLISYVFGGWYGARAGFESLRELRIDIDLLMVVAALGALVVQAPFEGAMLLFLFSLSNVLQQFAVGRSRSAIAALLELRPEVARVQRGDQWVLVALDEVRVGERFALHPGDRIPLDGRVLEGHGSVDQSSLTGESAPVGKGPGDEVLAGTINGSGSLEVEVLRAVGDSALARMIAMVESAQEEKAEAQRLIDRLEQPYALGVIGLTLAAILLPRWFSSEPFADSFYRAMTLMVAASPCALVISTPAAVLSAVAAAARSGVLFKGGVHVETAASIRTVAFDKTGTLTAGRTRLVSVVPLPGAGADRESLLLQAAAVQSHSEHHLARATLDAAAELPGPPRLSSSSDFEAVVGRGVHARLEDSGLRVFVGNPRYFEELAGSRGAIARAEEALAIVRQLTEAAQTVVLVGRGRGDAPVEILGVLGFADQLRAGARRTIEALRAAGVRQLCILTGDNEAVARTIGDEAGIDAVYSGLLPEDKVERLRELERLHGPIAMVGDGVNDAPALAAATLGVAMGGAGTDVALETADVVLMSDELDKIRYLLELSRRTRRVLIANFTISLLAMAVMVVAILWVGLSLPLAVVGHEGSTVLVSLNGLRLLAAKDVGQSARA